MSRTIATAVLAAASLAASTAHADPDQLCVPPAGTNDPAWWNPGLSPAKKEARWSGALVRKLAEGSTGVRVRALWSAAASTVYFEYSVHGDPSIDPDFDAVLVALGDETGTTPELFI